MSGYGEFAKFYDTFNADASDNVELIRRAMKQWRPTANSLLELGCGTGAVLSGFTDLQRLVGLDASASMLEIARTKVPSATFVLDDMAHFTLDEKFDVVACVFDALNHLERFEQWCSLFECVADHLEPGGLFVFDVNTLGRLEALVDAPAMVMNVDDATLTMTITDSGALTNWEIRVVSNAENEVTVASENIRELAVELDLVRTALSPYFEIVDDDDGTGQRPSDDSSRAFFVARRRR